MENEAKNIDIENCSDKLCNMDVPQDKKESQRISTTEIRLSKEVYEDVQERIRANHRVFAEMERNAGNINLM